MGKREFNVCKGLEGLVALVVLVGTKIAVQCAVLRLA